MSTTDRSCFGQFQTASSMFRKVHVPPETAADGGNRMIACRCSETPPATLGGSKQPETGLQ
eukprot:14565283-Alexandrium_andersonii.AAC.1